MRTLNLILLYLLCANLSAQEKPNVILFLTDDQGWGGTSLQMLPERQNSKSDYYLTPRLEAFAQEGMTFSQAYAPAAKCSPTRCSILTGKSTARSGFTYTDNSIADDTRLIEGTTIREVPTEDTLLSEWLKLYDPTYLTAHFGKWHIQAGGPAAHGFDRSDGTTSNSQGDQGGLIQSDPKKAFSLVDSAIAVMQDAVADDRPFYIQLSHYAPHSPTETRQNSLLEWENENLHPLGQRHDDPEFGAMTSDLDVAFGELLDELELMGLRGKTYVIYMSDNGAPGNNRPLEGGKNSCFEGGIRVPMVVSGPNIPQNVYNSQAVVGYDFYPTIIDWVQGNLTGAPAALDGVSLRSTLEGGDAATLNRAAKELIFHSPHYNTSTNVAPQSALVDGKYKLLVEYETDNLALFNLETDLGESNNLAAQEPEVFQDLCLRLRDYLKEVDAVMVTLNPDHPSVPGDLPDGDQDGLPDEWEWRELLTVKYGPQDDPDGDGKLNAMEWEQGTDPYRAEPTAVEEQWLETQRMIRLRSSNPVDQALLIRILPGYQSNNLHMRVYDSEGKVVAQRQTNGSNTLRIRASWPAGWYNLEAVDPSTRSRQRLPVLKQ
ncbi:MAG: sulfatase-like hydrolase/transferase [Saprospiraceae bacterium]|nr:sulfatase-like hydrolase/transferase [Saprospiraceae bacterium]